VPSVTSWVTEALIKLIKLQLSPNARLNQDTKVWNQIQRQRFKTQSIFFENLLELNQTLLPKANMSLMTYSASVQICKNYEGQQVFISRVQT
jgi:hypothetical protein